MTPKNLKPKKLSRLTEILRNTLSTKFGLEKSLFSFYCYLSGMKLYICDKENITSRIPCSKESRLIPFKRIVNSGVVKSITKREHYRSICGLHLCDESRLFPLSAESSPHSFCARLTLPNPRHPKPAPSPFHPILSFLIKTINKSQKDESIQNTF